MFAIPQTDWVAVEPSKIVDDLSARGLLLRNGEVEPYAELRRRDERLARDEWRPDAALYHFATKLRDVDYELPADEHEEFAEIAATADAAVERFVERHGPPPPHFHSADGAMRRVELPLVSGGGGLYELLSRRKTTRGFDRDRPMSLEQLSLVLYEVFGCRGYARIHHDVVALRKGSPSGGGLHPIEAYPLVQNVEGLDPGLYHYRVEDHALELLAGLDPEEARATLNLFTGGQVFVASAATAFVLTARFARNFWKYRRHPKAYVTLLMDAAHLSQTFYLVCTELGLGAFLTNLVNAGNIEERLGLDGYAEGALAVCACGVPAARSRLEPEFEPYRPRETRI